METEKYKDSIKVLMAIILLTILNFYIPLLSLLVLFVWPVPVAYLAVKHGMRQTGIIIVLSAVINGFLFGPMVGLITVIGFGFVGFIIGGSLNEDLSPLPTLLFTIGAVLVSHIFIVYISRYILGFDFNNLVNEITGFLSQTHEFEDLKQIIKTQIQIVKVIFPALMVISAIITGAFNYYIALWYLQKKDLVKEVYKPIKYWYFPRWFISLGLVISLIYKTNTIFLNINIVLLFITFIQGFAVGLYFISRKNNKIFLKWIYIILILFFPPFPVLLAVTGLIDMWFDFRKLRKQSG